MKFFREIFVLAGLLALFSCDSLPPETEADELEIEVVTAIIAGALSDRNEGLMSDIYDLTGELGTDGIRYAKTAQTPATPPWRGGTRNYSAWYDPATGTHTIEYERIIEMQGGRNALEARLQYIYRDVEGGFLQFPRRQRDDIASIEFSGRRAGSLHRQAPLNGRSMEMQFERTTDWYLDGLDTRSTAMRLRGDQQHEGFHRYTAGTSQEARREFSLTLETVDVTIQKPPDNSRRLEERVSGTLQYTIRVRQVMNGDERLRTHSGTIELAGDGHALLAFSGLRQVFRIKLAEGDFLRAR